MQSSQPIITVAPFKKILNTPLCHFKRKGYNPVSIRDYAVGLTIQIHTRLLSFYAHDIS